MIKVIIVEDQALVRGAISALLDFEDNINVVAQAENGVLAIPLIEKFTPSTLR